MNLHFYVFVLGRIACGQYDANGVGTGTTSRESVTCEACNAWIRSKLEPSEPSPVVNQEWTP